MIERDSTKQCPHCGNTHLVEIRSQNIKLCNQCPGQEIPWKLEPGQKPLL